MGGKLAELNAEFPAEEILNRKGPGGVMLAYQEYWKAVDNLNTILGSDAWSSDVKTVLIFEEHRDGKWWVGYRGDCIIRVTVSDVAETSRRNVGHGSASSRDRADAHEQAEKEAASDAFKRAAAMLGRRMGLALYDKEQRHVAPVDTADILARVDCIKDRAEFDALNEYVVSVAHQVSTSDRHRIKSAMLKSMKKHAPEMYAEVMGTDAGA